MTLFGSGDMGWRWSKESEKKRAEPGTESPAPVGEGSQELQVKEGMMGADGDSDLHNIDSAEESTDTEETVKTHMSDPKGSQ